MEYNMREIEATFDGMLSKITNIEAEGHKI